MRHLTSSNIFLLSCHLKKRKMDFLPCFLFERRFAIGVEQLALKADISMRPQVTTSTSGSNEEEIDPLRPPPVLMDFLPLAELCNSVLSSLNQIRLATPLALCFEMTERVQSLFDSGCRTLCAREARFNQSTSTETELQAFKR